MWKILPLSAFLCLPLQGNPTSPPRPVEALKQYLHKEKPKYQQRESKKRTTLAEVDTINSEQNRIREKISTLGLNHQEINMALENLSLEFQKQSVLEALEKERLKELLKVFYRMKRDGILRFIADGSDSSTFSARLRILFRALRSQSKIYDDFKMRRVRLRETEKKLTEAKQNAKILMEQLNEQQSLLKRLLDKKRHLLVRINKQQEGFEQARRDFLAQSKRLTSVFDSLESHRSDKGLKRRRPLTMLLPIESGKIIKRFGKQIHKEFRTVTQQKGIEIEAPHQTAVRAVLDGTVEFSGWVTGLGNVLILHHGSGLYSLMAHLFRSLVAQGLVVEKGETVALVGDTGQSPYSSLYFEVRENGVAVDPLIYFEPGSIKQIL